MKKMFESGYIIGKFEKTLPFFMLGEICNGMMHDEQKRNLKTKGAFNIIFNRKYTFPAYVRGYIFPIGLCEDERMKDVFFKLQRVTKKNRGKRNFAETVNTYLEENGFGYLTLSLYSPDNGYIGFKIKKEIYSELLSKGFVYATKIAGKTGKAIEILESKKFDYEKYTDFIEGIYTEENLLKRQIGPFRLIYAFENLTTMRHLAFSDYDTNRFMCEMKNLQKSMILKEDIETIAIDTIAMENKNYGWIDIIITLPIGHLTFTCSDAIDPFLSIYNWLYFLNNDTKNHSVYVDELGNIKTIEAYPFDEKLYLVFYDNDDILFECIVEREAFVSYFMSVLKDFVLNKFKIDDKKLYWRGEGLLKLIELFKDNEKN